LSRPGDTSSPLSSRRGSTKSTSAIEDENRQKYRDIRDIFSQPPSKKKQLQVNTHHGNADGAPRPPKSPLRPRTPGSVRSLKVSSSSSNGGIRSQRRPSVPILPTHTSSDVTANFPGSRQHRSSSISSSSSSVYSSSSSNTSIAPKTPTLGSISEKCEKRRRHADVKSVLLNGSSTTATTATAARKSMSATTVAESRLVEHLEEEGGKIELKDNDDKVITTYVSFINHAGF
jgi:hypothetical protein